MAEELYKIVCERHSYSDDGCQVSQKRMLQVFLAAKFFDLVAIKILKKLLRSTAGNQYIVIIITDGLSRLTRMMPAAGVRSMQVVSVFLYNWVKSYGIPSYVFSDTKPQFLSKCFKILSLSHAEEAHNHIVPTADKVAY